MRDRGHSSRRRTRCSRQLALWASPETGAIHDLRRRRRLLSPFPRPSRSCQRLSCLSPASTASEAFHAEKAIFIAVVCNALCEVSQRCTTEDDVRYVLCYRLLTLRTGLTRR